MDVNDSTRQFFKPFLSNLVTVLPSLSSSGKSHLVKHIVENSEAYFAEPPLRIVVVLCNPKVEAFVDKPTKDTSHVETLALPIEDFVPEQDLEPRTLLIFEDVQALNDKISTCINVYAHHLNLSGIFVLVQGLLGRSQVFPLLTLSHRVILFLQSTAVSRLANYILQFYQDLELRAYVKQILATAQREEDILLLEINKVRGANQPFYLAIQGMDRFGKGASKYPLVYPQPNKLDNYQELFGDNVSELSQDVPAGSFVLVPAQNVLKKAAAGPEEQDDCQSVWNQTLHIIRENLENNFPRKKLALAENLVREIMRTEQFCVTRDGRSIVVKSNPKTKTPLLDLLSCIIRQAGPNEVPHPKFAPFVKILLENGAPLLYFKNKSLLRQPSNSRRRRPHSSSFVSF